jgi:hypothetical protein
VGEDPAKEPPKEGPWNRPYAAPKESSLVIEGHVPIATVQAAIIDAIAKPKHKADIPVVVAEGAKKFPVDTNLLRTVTDRIRGTEWRLEKHTRMEPKTVFRLSRGLSTMAFLERSLSLRWYRFQ